jgi:AcrR family transcriptional regulator
MSSSAVRSPSRARGRPVDAGLATARRDQILTAASHFFARQGYADADLEQLADELGVGKGTLYRYFPSKQRLFLAALERGMERLHAAVSLATGEIEDDLERISVAVTVYLSFFGDHPELIELMILERAAFKGRGKPTYFAMRERYLKPWRHRILRLMRAGRVRRMDPLVVTTCIGNLLYGTLVTHHFTGRHATLRQQAGMLLGVLFQGILTPPATPSRTRP